MIEKWTILTSSRRIDKCPTPLGGGGREEGVGTLRINWAIKVTINFPTPYFRGFAWSLASADKSLSKML